MSEQEGIEYSALELNRRDTLSHEGPGARLKLMRQAKNIELVEMAKQLRLSPQRLEQIESDDYNTMGSGAYARGYLRSYARYLGMEDAEIGELMLLFRSLNLEAGIHTNKPQLINEKIDHHNPRVARNLLWILIIGLGLIAAFWWHKHSLATDKENLDRNTAATVPISSMKSTVETTLPTQPPMQPATTSPAASPTVAPTPSPTQPPMQPAQPPTSSLAQPPTQLPPENNSVIKTTLEPVPFQQPVATNPVPANMQAEAVTPEPMPAEEDTSDQNNFQVAMPAKRRNRGG